MVIQTKNDVTSILTAMHDINKATEDLHVKTNLVHTLHHMQIVGTLLPKNFKALLTVEELANAEKLVLSTKDNKPWYSIPRANFLGTFIVYSFPYSYFSSFCSCLLIGLAIPL